MLPTHAFAQSGKFSVTRSSLLRQNTATPLLVGFSACIQEIEVHFDFTCERLALFTSTSFPNLDQIFFNQVGQFFATTAKKCHLVRIPLHQDPLASFLEHQSTLRSLIEYADLILFPQLTFILPEKDLLDFYLTLPSLLERTTNVFALLDCPQGLTAHQTMTWAQPLVHPQMALFFGFLLRNDILISLATTFAALLQICDEKFSPFYGAFFIPLVDFASTTNLQNPDQQILDALFEQKINTTLMQGARKFTFVGDCIKDPEPTSFTQKRIGELIRQALEEMAQKYVFELANPQTALKLQAELLEFLGKWSKYYKKKATDGVTGPYSIQVNLIQKPNEANINDSKLAIDGFAIDAKLHLLGFQSAAEFQFEVVPQTI
jgi:hypothetical protein